jgi:hypothetical protein
MICSLCSRTALYMAGKKGFCGAHRDEAVAETAKDKRKIMSQMGLDNDGAAIGRKSEGSVRPWNGVF